VLAPSKVEPADRAISRSGSICSTAPSLPNMSCCWSWGFWGGEGGGSHKHPVWRSFRGPPLEGPRGFPQAIPSKVFRGTPPRVVPGGLCKSYPSRSLEGPPPLGGP
jgi:hypothetical protein